MRETEKEQRRERMENGRRGNVPLSLYTHFAISFYGDKLALLKNSGREFCHCLHMHYKADVNGVGGGVGVEEGDLFSKARARVCVFIP